MRPRRLPRLRGSLFVKIFFWFWTFTTLAGAILLAQEASRSSLLSKRWRGVTADAFAIYAQTAVDTFESDGRIKLDEYLSGLERRTSIEAYLLDETGYDTLKRNASKRPFSKSQSRWMRQQMQKLTRRAAGSVVTELAPLGTVTLAARRARTSTGSTLVLAGVLPSARYGPFNASPRVQLLRILAVLLASGLVCWGLGRHLTAPLESLRDATRRLAAGDLSARASLPPRRRDELTELSHDFNAMAERLAALLEDKERLVTSQRRLLADVSHELRSPLARLTVALEIARDRTAELANEGAAATASPGAGASSLEAVHDRIDFEASRLSEMLDRLLVLARMESGVQQPDETTVDLTALVEAVVADAGFESRSQQRLISLVEAEECVVRGTRDLLRSAVENVIRNATLHTPAGRSVEVRLVKRNGWAVVEVRDYGEGIPPEQLADVFRPFYRVSEARERKSGGVGLGLSITARAVQLHGGEVSARNAETGGLVVTIRLPLAMDITSEGT